MSKFFYIVMAESGPYSPSAMFGDPLAANQHAAETVRVLIQCTQYHPAAPTSVSVYEVQPDLTVTDRFEFTIFGDTINEWKLQEQDSV